MSSRTKKPEHGPFHKLFSILALLAALLGIVMGIWFFIFYQNNEETSDAQVEQYVTPVLTRVTGYIQEVRYEEHQSVLKGDTLIIIDPGEYRSRLEMALAERAGASGDERVLRQGASAAQSHVGVDQARLPDAVARLQEAEQECRRYQALFAETAVTGQQLEQKQALYESAKAIKEQVLQEIRTAQLNSGEAAARIPAANAFTDGKQAAVAEAALYLSYTVITAPYDGTVGRKLVQPGQLVKEGQSLVSVVSKEKWVVANYKETQLDGLKQGQEVTFKADASGRHVFHGIIESFSPASGARFSLLPPDNATGNFVKVEQRIPVRIRLTDPEQETGLLRAGMNVVVVAKHKK